MAVYDFEGRTPTAVWSPRLRILPRLTALVRLMQYSRLAAAMSKLTDEQLAQIGLDRKNIPQAAREAIYGTLPET